MVKPVSPKVNAASATALVSTLVTTFVLKSVDPSIVEMLVAPLVVGALTFAAGWLKRAGGSAR